MSTIVNLLLPVVLLVFTVPWCLRMLRDRTPAPALERVAHMASMTALVAVGAVVMRFDLVPAWTWYAPAAVVGVGAVALCLRWPALVCPDPPRRRAATVVSLVANAALLVLVMYASIR
ncbi:hypothetical protein [Arthrobacter sp. JSM 101049]|uniref:hypothetical protein n=1 Tax=Arthrobacter sp. JSM 101049 TaxID=929097 RepID=UPI0035643F09